MQMDKIKVSIYKKRHLLIRSKDDWIYVSKVRCLPSSMCRHNELLVTYPKVKCGICLNIIVQKGLIMFKNLSSEADDLPINGNSVNIVSQFFYDCNRVIFFRL